MPKNGIPDRWEYYVPIGDVIGRTRFVAFKVPLKESLCRKLPELKRFTPSILLNSISKLGMVIDLTNTNRYYNSTELTHCGIDYLKIFCEGRVVPNKNVVEKFFDAVEYYLQNNKNGLIGVHCTHGVNRTGYLICRYMIEKLEYTVKDAIKEFNKARGHDMERKEYIEHLYNLNSNICEKQCDQIVNKIDFKECANGKLSNSSNSQDSQENVAWESKYRNRNANDHTKIEMNYRKYDERNTRDCYRRNLQSTRWPSTERNAYDNFHYRNKFRNNNDFSHKIFSKNIQYKGNSNGNSFQNSLHYRRSFNGENSFSDRYVYCERNQNNFQSTYSRGKIYYTNKKKYFSD